MLGWAPVSVVCQTLRGDERQEPGPKELNGGAPVHLTAQGLESVDVPFDWAVAPRFGHGAFHRTEIVRTVRTKRWSAWMFVACAVAS